MTEPVDRRQQLLDELADIDRRFTVALGDEYDATHGAGVHLPPEAIDAEFEALDVQESAVMEELRAHAREEQRRGRAVLVPSTRRYGSSGPYFGFRRTWLPIDDA
ncbi:hypothetical protein [Actinomycetospora termitidis]|uniref:Uncharacterized protein n=1 Tax=Actinomycetospora termitidis TaxID=3053470 RepID=A0ABT7MED6_9PSEU|nr:hypothetical protein [Actinomycetospora sp. Odt1-22]MDL5159021.1 hypothetical protein [Actinomycetospora sp. Odt1-22]